MKQIPESTDSVTRVPLPAELPAIPHGTTNETSLRLIGIIAGEALRELGSKAADGAKARPTVAQLNRTLDRLASMVRLAEGGQ